MRNDILSEIKTFLFQNFCNRKYFACIYGSHADGTATLSSDLDLFVAMPTYAPDHLSSLKNFVVNLHKKYHLSLDNEIPYENKLMVTYNELDQAVHLMGLDVRNGKITVPPVAKTNEFLGSHEIKLRLVFNALTSPHLFIGPDISTYKHRRNIAHHHLLVLALNLTTLPCSRKDLVESLLVGENNEEGEMFLGYKRHRSVLTYLVGTIEDQLEKLILSGLVGVRQNGIHRYNQRIIKPLIKMYRKTRNAKKTI